MSSLDEQLGKNHRIRRNGKKYYLWIGERDIQFSAPNEADAKHADVYSLITALCRIISKGSKRPLTWEVVYDQLLKSSHDRPHTWAADIAQALIDGNHVEVADGRKA